MRKSIIFVARKQNIITNYPFLDVGNNRLLIMKVSEFLRYESPRRLQYLKAKNLRFVCDEGVSVYAFRTSDFKRYYCEVVADNVTIAFFPVRGSLSTCKLISRVVEVLDFLGYVKHFNK